MIISITFILTLMPLGAQHRMKMVPVIICSFFHPTTKLVILRSEATKNPRQKPISRRHLQNLCFAVGGNIFLFNKNNRKIKFAANILPRSGIRIQNDILVTIVVELKYKETFIQTSMPLGAQQRMKAGLVYRLEAEPDQWIFSTIEKIIELLILIRNNLSQYNCSPKNRGIQFFFTIDLQIFFQLGNIKT